MAGHIEIAKEMSISLGAIDAREGEVRAGMAGSLRNGGIMDHQELLDKTLEFVNRARAANDLEPLEEMPKGDTASPKTCPVARGINFGLSVGFGWLSRPSSMMGMSVRAWENICRELELARTDDRAYLPEHVKKFIIAFDGAEYPELIDRS